MVGRSAQYPITDTILGRIEYRYTNLETSGFVNVPMNSNDGGTRASVSDFRVRHCIHSAEESQSPDAGSAAMKDRSVSKDNRKVLANGVHSHDGGHT
jgi:hypothetical protein